MATQMENRSKRVLATFDFATVEKKDASGNLEYETVSSVNSDLKISPAPQIRTGQHNRITVTEEEIFSCKNDQVYNKKINVRQDQLEGNSYGPTGSSGSSAYNPGNNGNNQPSSENKDGLSPLQVLKNFVDQFHSDYSRDRTAQWVMIAVGTALGLTGMVLGIIALS